MRPKLGYICLVASSQRTQWWEGALVWTRLGTTTDTRTYSWSG